MAILRRGRMTAICMKSFDDARTQGIRVDRTTYRVVIRDTIAIRLRNYRGLAGQAK
jgi:hypothetical protein